MQALYLFQKHATEFTEPLAEANPYTLTQLNEFIFQFILTWAIRRQRG